jgi:hypothetical protein
MVNEQARTSICRGKDSGLTWINNGIKISNPGFGVRGLPENQIFLTGFWETYIAQNYGIMIFVKLITD